MPWNPTSFSYWLNLQAQQHLPHQCQAQGLDQELICTTLTNEQWLMERSYLRDTSATAHSITFERDGTACLASSCPQTTEHSQSSKGGFTFGCADVGFLAWLAWAAPAFLVSSGGPGASASAAEQKACWREGGCKEQHALMYRHIVKRSSKNIPSKEKAPRFRANEADHYAPRLAPGPSSPLVYSTWGADTCILNSTCLKPACLAHTGAWCMKSARPRCRFSGVSPGLSACKPSRDPLTQHHSGRCSFL